MLKQILTTTLLILCAGVLWAQPAILWTPDQVNFGTVGVNATDVGVVTIMNPGTETLDVNLAISGDGFSLPPNFSEVWHLFASARDSGLFIPIFFGPDSNIDYTGELTLTTNDPGHPTVVIPLTGTGGTIVPPPRLEFHLLQPENNADLEYPITFRWDGLDNPALSPTYHLYVMSDSSNGQSGVAEFDAGTETQIVVTNLALPGSSSYMWWVVATIGDSQTVLSDERWMFTLNASSHGGTEDVGDQGLVPTSSKVTAYPNPFNSQTSIQFSLAHEGNVTVTIYDILGREVAQLANGPMAAGEHRLNWRAEGPTGLYLLRMQTSSGVSVMQRLMYIK
jgi:hypothetical protein